jgi:PmbA protein
VLNRLIRAAGAAGADAADALLVESISANVSYRLGKLEEVERAESADLGLRVFVGQRVAFVSSTDFSRNALDALPARAVAMARLAPEDKFAGLAPRDLLTKSIVDLNLEDAREPAVEELIDRARAAEGAAMAVSGVTNSEGGGARDKRRVLRSLFRYKPRRRCCGAGGRRREHADGSRQRQRTACGRSRKAGGRWKARR